MAIATVLNGLFLVGWPVAAHASCAEGAGPEGSPISFVGLALEERRGYSKFEVTEVWAGPELARNVWVKSGQEQPPWPLYYVSGVASSVDAEFTIGKEYVVGASRGFDTSSCSITPAGANEIKPPAEVRAPDGQWQRRGRPAPGAGHDGGRPGAPRRRACPARDVRALPAPGPPTHLIG